MNDTSRRGFIAAGCALSLAACSGKNITSVKIAIGKTSDFVEGVNFLDFYRLVIRKRLEREIVYFSAMSKLCTHQSCLLSFETSTYTCPCHGSQFSENGSLIKGPARVNLPYYKLYFENRQLHVDFSEAVEPTWEIKCV